MKDELSRERLKKVHPILQQRITLFCDNLESQGLLPRIVQGYRTIKEQNDLYAQGRTRPGKIVTNAQGGQSYHNYGYAVDIAFLRPNSTVEFFISDDIGKLGTTYGLEWGGYWEFQDRPHFQLPGLPRNPESVTPRALNALVQALEKDVPVVSEYAKDGVAFAKTKGITSWNLPQKVVGTEELWHMMKKYGQIESDTPTLVSKEMFATWVHRLLSH